MDPVTIRHEALRLAISILNPEYDADPDDVLNTARQFEEFISGRKPSLRDN